MNIAWFWLSGLVAIALATGILSKSFKVHTTADSGTARGIITWGCVLMTLWIVYGGTLVLIHLTGK